MGTDAAATYWKWLCNGHEIFPEMLAAINQARESVLLEIYIYTGDAVGQKFREALIAARQRGVTVRVLYDALGSIGLSAAFWRPLTELGGEVRQFNPLSVHRLGIRNHRKILLCDNQVAFVGGFNIAAEYDGDGAASGWFDIGLKVTGALGRQLAAAFREMFERADFQHKLFVRFRRSPASRALAAPEGELLLSGPGRGRNPIRHALLRDLKRGRDVRIIAAYFLPTWRIRRALERIVRGGGAVRLLLAGKSDVLLSQLAGQSLYRRLLSAGVEINEYQPQILHAKLIIIDDVVYVGSANLDQRSLINYELALRFQNRDLADGARQVFSTALAHCRRITPEEWRRSRTVWRKLKQRWAYLLLVRIDPYLAHKQWRALAD